MGRFWVEEDQAVKQWLSIIHQQGTGSRVTKRNYLRDFTRFMDWAKEKGYHKGPSGFLKAAKVALRKNDTGVEMQLAEFFEELEKGGLSRNAAGTVFAAPRSFLRSHGVPLTFKFPSLWAKNGKYLPPREEIVKLLQFSDLRLRAQILTMRDSGLSGQELLALNYGDVRKGLEGGEKIIHIQLKREKVQTWFDTFIGPDAMEAIRDYVEYRKKGTRRIPPEKLKDSSPLWRAWVKGKGQRLSLARLKNKFHEAASKAGVNVTSHHLRKYFATTLKLAGVNDSLVEYWMGHRLGAARDPYFIPPIEKQREIYEKTYSELTFNREASRVNHLEKEVKKLREKLGEYEAAAEVRKPIDNELAQVFEDPEVQNLLVKTIRKLGLAKK